MSREENSFHQLDQLTLEELLLFSKTLPSIPDDLLQYILTRYQQRLSEARGKLGQSRHHRYF